MINTKLHLAQKTRGRDCYNPETCQTGNHWHTPNETFLTIWSGDDKPEQTVTFQEYRTQFNKQLQQHKLNPNNLGHVFADCGCCTQERNKDHLLAFWHIAQPHYRLLGSPPTWKLVDRWLT